MIEALLMNLILIKLYRPQNHFKSQVAVILWENSKLVLVGNLNFGLICFITTLFCKSCKNNETKTKIIFEILPPLHAVMNGVVQKVGLRLTVYSIVQNITGVPNKSVDGIFSRKLIKKEEI